MKMKKVLMSLVVSAVSLTGLTSCAVTKSNYVEVNKISTSPKDAEVVEYFVFKPRRSAITLGLISVDGNGFTSHQDVIKDAKKKAASLGGDFILEEKSGTETRTVVTPGYSSYQSNGNAFVNNNYGSAYQNAYGYSVGPSVSTIQLPWAVFSVWIYKPSHTGLDVNDDSIITGFNLNSDAEEAGLNIGDKIIGVDGFDIKDDGLLQHVMTIQPGDKIVCSITRDGKRMDFTITALPNK